MRRRLVPLAVAAVLALPLAPPAMAAPTAPNSAINTAATNAAAAVNQVADLVSSHPASVTAKKNKKKKVKKVTLKANHKQVGVDGIVKLSGQVKPKQKAHVGFQQKFPGSTKWYGAGTKVTKKSGKASVKVQLGKKGTFKYRMFDKKKKSRVVSVQAVPTPGPGPTPPPPPPPPPVEPKNVTADWPDGQLSQDKQYYVPVTVDPAVNVQVRLQENSGNGWDDLYGGANDTGGDGTVKLVMSVPDTGDVKLRVAVTGFPEVKSEVVTRNFTDEGDALFAVPLKLPNKTGQIVKAQEYPLTYPTLKLPNPIDPTQPLVLPQVGDPAAGPPKCVTDGTARADCPIPGKQYRIMYTTERWYPNQNGGGSVQNGTVAATGLLFVPPGVKDNAPVVVWAHPTLGQEDKCSISRGTGSIPSTNGATGQTTMGPGGMDINLTDVVFFLDQMLQEGYVVVMPDYLGIAVDSLDINQNLKTYAVGPQEARDVYYAAQALQDGAKNGRGWPGLSQAGKRFIVAGHSQGGHAALWTGASERKDFAQNTGMNLKGVISIAPATDLNKLVDVSWDNQANWVIGPEIIQTWVGYLPQFALQNNTLSNAVDPFGPNPNVLAEYESYCTTQAFAASYKYFPGGLTSEGTPFMKDPNAPANQQAFYNWGQIFNSQTPVIDQGQMNSYPKDMPTQLISGTADQVVLSQVNAAMQENFCDSGADLSAYWTPVATGVANPNPPATDAFQAADHLNVLAFPFANNMGTDANPDYQLAGGRILDFAADRFAGKDQTPDCGKTQTVHTFKNPLQTEKPSWYVFPRVTSYKEYCVTAKICYKIIPQFDANAATFYETNGSPYLPTPAKPVTNSPKGGDTELNPPPAPGKVTLPPAGSTELPTQEGCGFQYVQKSFVSFPENPACYQWGLYPYDKLIYPSAQVGKSWGGKDYPFVPPKP